MGQIVGVEGHGIAGGGAERRQVIAELRQLAPFVVAFDRCGERQEGDARIVGQVFRPVLAADHRLPAGVALAPQAGQRGGKAGAGTRPVADMVAADQWNQEDDRFRRGGGPMRAQGQRRAFRGLQAGVARQQPRGAEARGRHEAPQTGRFGGRGDLGHVGISGAPGAIAG